MKNWVTQPTASKSASSKKRVSTSVKSSWKKDFHEIHKLQEIFDRLNLVHFAGKLETKILWARQAKKQARSYRRLGCYMPLKNLIKINPILNQESVPAYFIEYIVYHEMLHAVYPPIAACGRRWVHHKKFMEMEKAFPSYKLAKAWEESEGRNKLFFSRSYGRS